MDWFCCDVWNWKPWPLPADIGVKPVFFCPFKPSLGSQDTDVRPIWVSLEMLAGPGPRTYDQCPPRTAISGYLCLCVFSCAMLLEDGPQKNVFFCSPLGLGFGPFNFPQFPTTSIISDSIWENGKQNKARVPIFQLPVNFFHNFIPDGPRLTKSLHLRGFPSSLRLLLPMLSRFRLLFVVII